MPHKRLTVYLSGPMSGVTFAEALKWRREAEDLLSEAGFRVLNPLRGLEESFGPESVLGIDQVEHALGLESHAWFMRDKFDTTQADIILVNFVGARRVSLGTVMEVAWAFVLGKFVVIAMEPKGNPHDHLFIKECACKLLETPAEGAEYIVETFR